VNKQKAYTGIDTSDIKQYKKEYHKQYRIKNKEKRKKRDKIRDDFWDKQLIYLLEWVDCDCGEKYIRYNSKKHKRSQKHLNYINKIEKNNLL
jgi:hypothetical protein